MAPEISTPASTPLVSVVVAVLNGEATLDACILSLLGMDWPAERLEIIVVDNASTDGTPAILERHSGRIRGLYEPRRGPSAARNTGVREARGEWIAFTDADCVVEPSWLRNLVAPLQDPTVGLVGGRILSVQPCNWIERFGERIHDHRRAIEEFDPPYAITMNWASPRDVLLRVGLFDELLMRAEDVGLSRRILAAGHRIVYSHDAVIRHRNERTLYGLFGEGSAHGTASVILQKRGPGIHPLRGRPRLLPSVAGIIRGPDRHTALCQLVFDAGKWLGTTRARSRRIPVCAPRPLPPALGDPLGSRADGRPPQPSSRKLLLASYEPPGFGGAATAGYDLFRTLQREGHDVAYVSLLDERDRAFFEYTFDSRLGNPERLDGVHAVEIGPPMRPNAELAEVIAAVGPDLLVAIGYLAALALRASAPDARLLYLTSGCPAAERMVADRRVADAATLLDRLEDGALLLDGSADERTAIAGADHVVAHSPMTLRFVQRLYPTYTGRMHPVPIGFGPWIGAAAARYEDLARPFDNRSIGALFVASTWDRPEKNYDAVRQIADRLTSGTVHVVGDVPGRIAGAVHHGFVADRAALFMLMGDARAVVCPSLIDAAPGILFEGAALGCNLVASRNCGNHGLCHPELLAEPRTPDAYAERIERALARRYPAPDDGAGTGGYADLVEILAGA